MLGVGKAEAQAERGVGRGAHSQLFRWAFNVLSQLGHLGIPPNRAQHPSCQACPDGDGREHCQIPRNGTDLRGYWSRHLEPCLPKGHTGRLASGVRAGWLQTRGLHTEEATQLPHSAAGRKGARRAAARIQFENASLFGRDGCTKWCSGLTSGRTQGIVRHARD